VVDKGSNPVWSPHGTRLAFEGPRGITVVSASGSGPIRALHKGANPVWSPHGTRIAFDQGGEIMTMSSRGKGVRRLRRGSVAAWSSRGEIAYYGAHGLSVMSANGEHVHLVARDGVGADWSPDGQRLAFALQSRQQIATSDAGGRHVTRLGARGDAASAPRWSPNGNLIAVAGCARAGCGVYVMHRDGSKRQLVRNTDRDCPKGSVCSARDISWQPLLPFRRGRTNGQTFFGGGEVSRHR
jgi:Tol biopolymer transport system component